MADKVETRTVCPACGHVDGVHLQKCRIAELEKTLRNRSEIQCMAGSFSMPGCAAGRLKASLRESEQIICEHLRSLNDVNARYSSALDDGLRKSAMYNEACERIAELEAKLDRLRAGQWLPIETAPKDGTPFLGWVPTYYQGKGAWVVVLRLHGDLMDNRAWKVQPTGWQALPPAPTEGAEK